MSDDKYGRYRIREMLPKRSEDEIFEFLSIISGEISEGSIKSGGMAMHFATLSQEDKTQMEVMPSSPNLPPLPSTPQQVDLQQHSSTTPQH